MRPKIRRKYAHRRKYKRTICYMRATPYLCAKGLVLKTLPDFYLNMETSICAFTKQSGSYKRADLTSYRGGGNAIYARAAPEWFPVRFVEVKKTAGAHPGIIRTMRPSAKSGPMYYRRKTRMIPSAKSGPIHHGRKARNIERLTGIIIAAIVATMRKLYK